MVVRHRESRGLDRRRLWRAVDLVSPGDEARRAAARLGQSADLDGPRRGDPRGPSPIQRNLRPRRRRPGRRRGKAVSGLDRFLGDARARSDARHDHRAARNSTRRARTSAMRCGSTPISRWFCRATPATAGNRSADRPRIISASRFSRRQAASPSTTNPIEVTGQAWMDREWSSQPLASDQTGWDWFSLHLNTGEKLMLFRLRQTDGNHYCSGNWISRGRQNRADRIRRHQDDADSLDRNRRTQDPDGMAHRDSHAARWPSRASR